MGSKICRLDGQTHLGPKASVNRKTYKSQCNLNDPCRNNNYRNHATFALVRVTCKVVISIIRKVYSTLEKMNRIISIVSNFSRPKTIKYIKLVQSSNLIMGGYEKRVG